MPLRCMSLDPGTIALIIIVVGALLIIAEVFSPGVFLLVPGTVFVVIGIVGYAFPDFLMSWYSPVAALLLAVPVTAVTIKGYQLLGTPEPPTTTIASNLVGKVGTVTTGTSFDNIKGKVKIDNDTWSATSEVPLKKGTKVVVISAEGVHVKVEEREE